MQKVRGAAQRQEIAERITQDHLRGTGRQRGRLMALVVIVAVVGAVGLLWLQSRDDGAGVVVPQYASDDYGFVLTPELVGAEGDATDAVVLYEDFLCSSCKAFHEASGGYLADQVAAAAIALEYRPIAFLSNSAGDEYSQRAANAAVCVADAAGVEAYATMHDLLLVHQPPSDGPGLSDAELAEYAAEAGADDISACIEDRTFGPWLDEAFEASRAADVSETPTVRVNDQTVVRSDGGEESMPGTEELSAVIDGAV